MSSRSIKIYNTSSLTPEQLEFVDSAYKMCEDNYERGGDTIVECYTPEEIIECFGTLDEVKEFCGLHVEQALNRRWGSDGDEELKRYERFQKWED